MEFKELYFARKESEGSWCNPTEWLGRYIYSGIHKIFFSDFPIVLHEWLSKLETQQINFQGREPREWHPQLIERLKRVSNPISWDMDFWVDIILEGYITKFDIDTITSYSEADIFFFKDHATNTCHL